MWFGAMYEYAGIGKPAVSIEILNCEEKREKKIVKISLFWWFTFKKLLKKSEKKIYFV